MIAARRLRLGTLAWLCVLVGVLVLWSASAFAAAPEAPVVEVSSRKATEIGLRGVLYPNAPGEPGSYEFLYKQSASECEGGGKGPSGVATGNQFEEVFETLSGLEAGKQYTVCLAVTGAGGTTLSAPVTVTTAIAPEAPEVSAAQPVAATTATLHGVLNPGAERKSEPGSYEFLYKQSASECEGESTTPSTGAAGAKQEAVSASLTGLLPHTTYTFCLRQLNEAGEVATSAPASFTTLAAAPSIEDAGVTHVTASSATFLAKINPQGAETSYIFEYAPAGGVFVPVPEAEGKGGLPEGTSGVPVSVHMQQGLLPDTTYELRVLVSNAVQNVIGETVSFTTQRLGSSLALPDGRQYEMVSPPQKKGAQLRAISDGIIQGAADGNAFTDESFFEPIEDKADGTANFYQANFFGRGQDGWVPKTISAPRSVPGVTTINFGQEYRFFSEDLSKAIFRPFGPAAPLTPGVSESTAYVHTDYLNDNPAELCGSNCFQPLVSEANVPPGTKYGEEQAGPCPVARCGPEVVAVSPDLSHVLISSSVALTTDASEEFGGLYEWTGGKLTFVGVGSVGFHGLVRHVISDDGSRIFFEGQSEGVSGLLMRDTATKETIAIGGGGYEDANAEGSRVFFHGEECAVKRSETTGKLECPVVATDGTVVGASEDGSYVYFAATGVLAPSASPATCSGERPVCMNLYVRHDGVTTFVGDLSAEDSPDWIVKGGNGLTVRVSPNGRWFTFMSNRDLIGYDTTDAVSGRPDEEVYLYSASTGKLVCGSCNPTGGRPVGVEYGHVDPVRIVAGESIFESSTWIASNVPPWTRMEIDSGSYQSRYLSNSGRLFFDSKDALVPQDVNGTQDVYEYEPSGVGTCTTGAQTFSGMSGGCASLVSSGESAAESAFLDASGTGGDVFFLTAAKLAPQDFDTENDIYDARDCGEGPSRCLAPESVTPPPCDTSDSCKPAPTTQPAIFGSPASATFSGAGNLTPSSGAHVVTPKALTRAQQLTRALKACARKKGKRRRRCERQSRARYGAKANATKGSGR